MTFWIELRHIGGHEIGHDLGQYVQYLDIDES